MASIDLATAKIIVENAMRQNRMGGTIVANGVELNLENAWKTIVEVNGQPFEIPINYQNFRDAIAQSLVDTLTALSATGNISLGPIDAPGQQIVAQSPNINLSAPAINLNNPTLTPRPVARVGDSIVISDPVFLAWIQTVSTALSIVGPATVTGQITTGSATVNVGG